MLLIKFASGVCHLWLNPDTEFDTTLLRVFTEIADAVRQLAGIYHPVAQGCIVAIALVLATKPTIVHHEQFTPHHGDVVHHLMHALLSDVEIDTLPRVQQYLALLIAMPQTVFASPLVEVA